MRILIPAGAIAAILWLISRPEWQHASHGKKIVAVVAVAVVFVALEVLAAFARSRRPRPQGRSGLPYAAPAKRR
jgi:hypothetical protein